MKLDFYQLIEVPFLQQLMDHLWEASGLPIGILDPQENVLVTTGWQPICTEFHRRNEKTLERCRQSAAYIKARLAEKDRAKQEEPVEYLCRNGLVDAALPVFIEGRHLATLFLGQFFYEPPDEAIFRRQAREFGFDGGAYLEALRKVPVFSREKVHAVLAFYRSLVQMLCRMGTERLERLRAQEKLLNRKQRLRVQNREMRRIGGKRAFCRDPEQFISDVVETAARTLEVKRAGFWRFTSDGQRLSCVDLFEALPGEPRPNEDLEISRFPDYFLSLETSANIAADHAWEDPRTRELTACYLEPHGITSLLDSPVWLGDRMIGVLCCDHTGEPRRWSLDEQNFAASMADQISQALEWQERRLAEEAIRESEEKYRLLFNHDSDAVLFFDAETLVIEEVNQAAALLYGYSREDFAGFSLIDISAEPEKTRQKIGELSGEGMVRYEVLHLKRDGSSFPAEVAHGACQWKGRRMCVGVVRDVSERQDIMRLKDEMLSAVSHEMRTPLTAILGFSQYLRENHDQGVPVKDYLDIILKEGERLRELTDNLLDLQRLRAGFGRKTFRLMEVSPLIASVVQLFDHSESTHRLVISKSETLPSLWGDERQLYRALQNLLSNAFKYSPEGSTVELGADSDGDFLHFWVSDEGGGIPPEHRGEIFERFFRIDYEKGGQVGGTGLGLALVKAVAETHRGQVWVEGRPEGGSKFMLSIPYAPPPDETTAGKASFESVRCEV